MVARCTNGIVVFCYPIEILEHLRGGLRLRRSIIFGKVGDIVVGLSTRRRAEVLSKLRELARVNLAEDVGEEILELCRGQNKRSNDD